jgi:hypothetical protein
MSDTVFNQATIPTGVTLSNGGKTATLSTVLSFVSSTTIINNTYSADDHVIEFTIDVGGSGGGSPADTAPILQILDTGSATPIIIRKANTEAEIGLNTTAVLADLVAGDIITMEIDLDSLIGTIYRNGVQEFQDLFEPLVGVAQASVVLGTDGTQVTVRGEDPYQITRGLTFLNWSTKFEFDPVRKSLSQDISVDGLTVTQLNNVFGGKTWALEGIPREVTDKRYMEFTIVSATGETRVGGVSSDLGESVVTTNALGRRSNEVGFSRLGDVFVNNAVVQSGLVGWSGGDVVSMLSDNGRLSFWVNGTVTGVPQVFSGTTEVLASVSVGLTPSVVTANFGETAFTYAIPVGFIPWNGFVESTFSSSVMNCSNDIIRDIRMYDWETDLLVDEVAIDMTIATDYALTGEAGQVVYLLSVPADFVTLASESREILTAGPITLP